MQNLWDFDNHEHLRGERFTSERYNGDHKLEERFVPRIDNKGLLEVIAELEETSSGLIQPRLHLGVDADGKVVVKVAGWRPMTDADHELRERLRQQKRNRDEEARKNAEQHESCCANCRQK